MGNCIPKQDWGTPTGDGFTDISAAPRTNSKVDAPPSNPNEALSYAEHVIGDLLKGDVNADEQREALQQVAVALRRATADAKNPSREKAANGTTNARLSSHPKDILNKNVGEYISSQFDNSQARPALAQRRKSVQLSENGELITTAAVPTASANRRSVIMRRAGVLPPSIPELEDEEAAELEDMLKNVDSDDEFDVWALDRVTGGNALVMLTWHLLTKVWKSCELLGVNETKLDAWLHRVQQHYVDTPYHNHVHASDVLHLTHVYLRKGLYKRMDDVEIFSLIIAAASHDVGHDGLTNAYHSSRMTDLAIVYNDISVQENGHAYRAFDIMNSHAECNFIDGLERDFTSRFRSLVISNILGTDMVGHKTMITEFETYLNASDDGRDDTVALPSAGFLSKVVLHLADINNAARKWDLAEFWANRCLAEFFNQGDMEKKLELPVSPLCDRSTTDIPKSQIGFIDFVVMPAFVQFARLLPYAQKCVDRLNENKELWKTRDDVSQKAKLMDAHLPYQSVAASA